MSGPLPKEAPVLPPLPESVNETFKILENNPVVKDALKQIKEEEQLTMADQIALTEIEAPPFHEEVRAAYFAERLRELGLTNVRIDKEGNVIGIRPGKGNGPRLVLGAHLDTVFPAGTNVKVRQEGTKYYAPGISDDARGLAVVLEVLRTLQNSNIRTEGDLLFIGSVEKKATVTCAAENICSLLKRNISTVLFPWTLPVWHSFFTVLPAPAVSASPMKDPEDTAGLHSAFPVPRTH